MEVYVVQQGDNIDSIAANYNIAAEKIILDNGLVYPYDLVVGQAIIVVPPKISYVVQDGDTLQGIANYHKVPLMQLLRNNPELTDREYIYPGETLVISYSTSRSITTNGFAYPFIKKDTLHKTLPNLTYLSIFNYTVTKKGVINAYYEEDELIKECKAYQVVPLIVLTTLTPLGVPDVETAYNILLNKQYQERIIENLILIMKRKGYLGVNFIMNYLNRNNQLLYQIFTRKLADRLKKENFLLFISINCKVENSDDAGEFMYVDYLHFSEYVNGMEFLGFVWGTNSGPPGPVSNLNYLSTLVKYAASEVPPDKIIVGKPILGYDWKLPYVPGQSYANSLTINSVLDLVNQSDITIRFDENSKTPYFYYHEQNVTEQHVIWFIDARSIELLIDLILRNELNGSGVWSIMIYNKPLWTIMNANFDIIKLLSLGKISI